jgi:cytochrome c553
MTRSAGLLKIDRPWVWIGWSAAAGLLTVGAILGFLVLGREQQNGPPLGAWAAICRGLGIGTDTRPADEPKPPLFTPTRIAWTGTTLAQVADGDLERGEFVAINCTACHGEHGLSASGLFPTLAGMDAAVIYKQLDDFRAGKRAWGAMNGIAQALSAQASADVAAYFASRSNGLAPSIGAGFRSGRSLRAEDPATRLVFAGDPARGIAPCSACHGPGARKLGAPLLQGQQPAYIERQLAAFAQGVRENDINWQMRNIAAQLTPGEMHLVAEFYGADVAARIAGR